MSKTYVITANHPNGSALYLSRRQNREAKLLGDSVTTNKANAFRWTDADGSYNLADAETFRAHAEQYAPAGWQIVEA
jgi:hypothetical protein